MGFIQDVVSFIMGIQSVPTSAGKGIQALIPNLHVPLRAPLKAPIAQRQLPGFDPLGIFRIYPAKVRGYDLPLGIVPPLPGFPDAIGEGTDIK